MHRSIQRPRPRRGFTLIELMAVIAIMVIIATLSVGAIKSFGSAYELDSSVQGISGALNAARQIALSQNKYVQVRFYEQTNASDIRYQNYFAIGTYISDSPFYPTNSGDTDYQTRLSRGWMKQLGTVYVLPNSIGIIKSATNSALLDSLRQDSNRTNTDSVGRMRGYPWVSFYFSPQGAIDVPYEGSGTNAVPIRANKAFFSLCEMRKYQGGQLPPNYATVLFDPANGRMQTVRP